MFSCKAFYAAGDTSEKAPYHLCGSAQQRIAPGPAHSLNSSVSARLTQSKEDIHSDLQLAGVDFPK